MKAKWSFVLLASLIVTVGFNRGLAGEAKKNLIEMDKVPLSEAIRQLARQAQLNIILAPRLSQPPLAGMTVTVHWEGVTAKEALVALLDNYGLTLVEAARPSPAR